MDIFSRVMLGVGITFAALPVAGVVLMYVLLPYFPEGIEPYAEEFKELDEVKALYRAYPMAVLHADPRIAYLAMSGNGSGTIELLIHHKHHSFEVIGMRLTCWDGGGGGSPVWSVDEDILHHIESRRCF